MHHRETILDRHRLLHTVLEIEFGAPERRKDIGLPGVDQMAAIELGGDLHGELDAAHFCRHPLEVGDGAKEIAAHEITGSSSDKPYRRVKLFLATPAGLEPATCRLEGGCSIQLSYGASSNPSRPIAF